MMLERDSYKQTHTEEVKEKKNSSLTFLKTLKEKMRGRRESFFYHSKKKREKKEKKEREREQWADKTRKSRRG